MVSGILLITKSLSRGRARSFWIMNGATSILRLLLTVLVASLTIHFPFSSFTMVRRIWMVDFFSLISSYNNNPILKWCLTNTGIQTDRNGNIVPVKNQSPKQRIDGTAALLDCYVGLYEHYNEFTGAI